MSFNAKEFGIKMINMLGKVCEKKCKESVKKKETEIGLKMFLRSQQMSCNAFLNRGDPKSLSLLLTKQLSVLVNCWLLIPSRFHLTCLVLLLSFSLGRL